LIDAVGFIHDKEGWPALLQVEALDLVADKEPLGGDKSSLMPWRESSEKRVSFSSTLRLMKVAGIFFFTRSETCSDINFAGTRQATRLGAALPEVGNILSCLILSD
jgi:hypothetical protein